MIGKKIRKAFTTQIILLLCFISNFALSLVIPSHSTFLINTIVVGFFLAILIDQYLLEFRIKKGWYGTNQFEAREIINFINNHSNKDDFNDNDGLKKILSKADDSSDSIYSDILQKGKVI